MKNWTLALNNKNIFPVKTLWILGLDIWNAVLICSSILRGYYQHYENLQFW